MERKRSGVVPDKDVNKQIIKKERMKARKGIKKRSKMLLPLKMERK